MSSCLSPSTTICQKASITAVTESVMTDRQAINEWFLRVNFTTQHIKVFPVLKEAFSLNTSRKQVDKATREDFFLNLTKVTLFAQIPDMCVVVLAQVSVKS